MATSVDVVLANYFAVTATMLLACMFLTGDTMLWCLLGILCFAAASLCAWVIVVLRRRIVPISKRRGSEDAHPEIMDADRRELSSIWFSRRGTLDAWRFSFRSRTPTRKPLRPTGANYRKSGSELSVAYLPLRVHPRVVVSPDAEDAGEARNGSCLARSADRPSRRKQSRVLHGLPDLEKDHGSRNYETCMSAGSRRL